MNGFPNC